MQQILRDAVADAKAVKESAILNAKLALEEAFVPRIQSMISAKLQNEAEEDDEEVSFDDYSSEETIGDLDDDSPEMDDMEMEPEMDLETEPEMDPEMEPEMEPEMDLETEPEMNPEMDDMEISADEDEDINLDELLAELESETDSQDFENDSEEEIDLNSLLESEEEYSETEESEDVDSMKQDLQEAYQVINVLRNQLQEINLLNAKLLYSNKLFRKSELSESQKFSIIEHFDRAKSIREVKLIYSTLSESIKGKKKPIVKESIASKPVASTKPSKKLVLNEDAAIASRFRELAYNKKNKNNKK